VCLACLFIYFYLFHFQSRLRKSGQKTSTYLGLNLLIAVHDQKRQLLDDGLVLRAAGFQLRLQCGRCRGVLLHSLAGVDDLSVEGTDPFLILTCCVLEQDDLLQQELVGRHLVPQSLLRLVRLGLDAAGIMQVVFQPGDPGFVGLQLCNKVCFKRGNSLSVLGLESIVRREDLSANKAAYVDLLDLCGVCYSQTLDDLLVVDRLSREHRYLRGARVCGRRRAILGLVCEQHKRSVGRRQLLLKMLTLCTRFFFFEKIK